MPGGILTLDLATKTGWAVADEAAIAAWPRGGGMISAGQGPSITYGTKAFQPGNTVPGQLLGWLEDMLHEHPYVTTVVFEAPFIRRGREQTAMRLLGMKGVVEACCARCHLRCFEVPVPTIKKHFTGHGRAGKAEMIKMARVLGFDPEDDNSADAIGLLSYSIACFQANKAGAA